MNERQKTIVETNAQQYKTLELSEINVKTVIFNIFQE